MSEIPDILYQYWRYHSFRPLQEEIITNVLEGKDALALLPTGGGKSVCYQVPALAQEGICLVISPLIALMKDQVENLKQKGVLAAAIYSGMSRRQIVQTLKNVAHGPYKLLYVSPERLESNLFKEYLPALNINLIAVDEAHCISQWGYDFRPSYLRIAALKEELPGVPILALTASATELVQKDICEKLLLKDVKVFRQSYTRANLSYSAFTADSKLSKLVDIVSKVQGSAIVYCKSRRRTVEISDLLGMHGISASHYHAGLSQEQRSQRQQDWIENKIRVITCTNAFGMGIDKPDVRLVVHADMPDSLESYYQEAGRAGRDAKKSYAVLLFNNQDIAELEALHLQRYPSFEEIRHVYTSLANFLQIPVNGGEGETCTFQFENFISNFKLHAQTTLYALKAIEQDGWLDMNERSFAPSTVVFSTSKQLLRDFQESHSEYEPILTTMLRTYGGIFDVPVFISEMLLAKILYQSEEEIKAALKKLHAWGIIEYAEQNDKPQITLRKQRVADADFKMNLTLYEGRRQAFIERVQHMIAYAQTTTCRSLFINHYFGDKEDKACGVCDECLKKKTTALTNEEFQSIYKIIQTALSTQKLTTTELFTQHLRAVRKEKAWEVIRFLQAEEKLIVDARGYLSCK